MEELYKSLDEVIECIKESPEYKDCLKIKKQMDSNKELVELIDKVKDLQKKYVKSNYDSKIKKELAKYESELNEIPIYNIYLSKLDEVNYKIDYVKDSLNSYFDNLLNKKY
ncbi:MAG: YlbF family regulator [Bacilli bacterium]|nr:YlbF family regulator [Bacilli bacterium]